MMMGGSTAHREWPEKGRGSCRLGWLVAGMNHQQHALVSGVTSRNDEDSSTTGQGVAVEDKEEAEKGPWPGRAVMTMMMT